MPGGKPAGVRCIQLTPTQSCAIFGSPLRPACCSGLRPSEDMCGPSPAHALHWLTLLERQTAP
jgi:hypothetical protein